MLDFRNLPYKFSLLIREHFRELSLRGSIGLQYASKFHELYQRHLQITTINKNPTVTLTTIIKPRF